MLGRPGDSPEVGPTAVFTQHVRPSNRATLLAVCEKMADLWTERAMWGAADGLDVAAVRYGFLSKLVVAVSNFNPEHYESSIVFKDETIDESAWVTTVRVYFDEEQE